YGCMGGYAACTGCVGAAVAPAAPKPPAEPGVTPKPPDKPPGEGDKGAVAAPATIVVSLPANARLTIDGAPTTSTSPTPLFATPVLQTGRDFYYTLRAEVVRNGQTVAQTQRVAVRAGQETRVALPLAATQTVASR